MSITVLDLDGSLTWQAPIDTRLEDGRAERRDLRDMGRALRLWAWEGDYRRFAASLPARRPGRPDIVLLGSGDYHHLTPALLARLEQTVVVVHFDNHPDWAWTFPARHCGSWVHAALALGQVERVVTLGCCSDDLGKPDRAGVNLAALRSGRLVMRPWSHPPTRLGRLPMPVPGHRVDEGWLHWSNLAEADWDTALGDLFDQIAGRPVWISLDKDVLAPAVAATNWDQGRMPLAFLERALAALLDQSEVLGIDMCGDWSPARHRQPMKVVEALMDQPRQAPADLSVNENLNERLLGLLEERL
jgi:hypothetical protein